MAHRYIPLPMLLFSNCGSGGTASNWVNVTSLPDLVLIVNETKSKREGNENSLLMILKQWVK
ncbi:hypothetical protein [Aeromonas simiae]|uniref:hypothetical protein n=1 Tax=Aeromonas simiae TaxID=218936 RepID=UPI0012ECDAE8|nr:hypothetical protein [Aeromonas simiae]MDO2948528.1 hypothetical protein [Aeromonas simiae]MDO2951466.1 hypothetical protein [Aeromonas simiae]MDO2955911.1 hypothetical protein [Aeromonas simiae]